MRKKVWNEKKLNQAKYLVKCHSTRMVGNIFNTTKNAVIGALYREKVKNGYVPPPDSKYTVLKIRHGFKRDSSLGKRKCNICENTFTKSGRFDRFCYECRRTGRIT